MNMFLAKNPGRITILTVEILVIVCPRGYECTSRNMRNDKKFQKSYFLLFLFKFWHIILARHVLD